MTTRYMTTTRFRELTIMPGPDVDMLDQIESGWIQKQIDRIGAWINSRLAKRYAVPFGTDAALPAARTDVPEVIEEWITALLTPRCYGKRGHNPSSSDVWFQTEVIDPSLRALADVKEAADSDTGLFDLPLLQSTAPDGTGVTRGGPMGYSEQSPFVWTDRQYEEGSAEDGAGRGTSR